MADHPTADSPFQGAIDRFSGFAADYDAARPVLPPTLLDLLTRMAQSDRPRLVVDLGCGTGLSTRVWASRADRVVGIDPTPDMLAVARAATHSTNVEYRRGLSSATGLDGGKADLAIASQALHWMDPEPTFAEAARILRPGGVFAACDVDWPPSSGCWQAEQAWETLMARVASIQKERALARDVRQWDKSRHLQRMAASGRFRFVRELVLHGEEPGGADRFIALALSQGHVQTVLKAGVSAQDAGIEAFEATVRRHLPAQGQTLLFGYRVRIGVA